MVSKADHLLSLNPVQSIIVPGYDSEEESIPCQLKAALHARLASEAWPDQLPWVLLGVRVTPKTYSAISSTALIFV
jgi:hypothetical protein